MSVVTQWLLPLAVGAATGILSGFGVGGGTLLLVYLTAFAGVDQHQAQGVNLLYFLPAALLALPAHVKNGYIRRDPTKPRTIEILDDEFGLQRRELVNIPILGNVAAGLPTLAEQNIEGYYPIPAELLPNKPTFMLNVHGDSMVNAGILDGDQVICAEASTADNGQIVVALIDDSATVKRFFREKDHIRLQPENDFMDPIIVDGDVRILGKVIGLLRLSI